MVVITPHVIQFMSRDFDVNGVNVVKQNHSAGTQVNAFVRQLRPGEILDYFGYESAGAIKVLLHPSVITPADGTKFLFQGKYYVVHSTVLHDTLKTLSHKVVWAKVAK